MPRREDKKDQPIYIRQIYFKIFLYGISFIFALALFGLINLHLPTIGNLFLAFLLILILPGYALFNLFFYKEKLELHEKLANYFVFSLLVLLFPVTIAYFFNTEIGQLIKIIFCLIVPLAMFDLELTRKRKINFKISRFQFNIKLVRRLFSWNYIRVYIVFILGGIFAFLVFRLGELAVSDVHVYIAIVRKLMLNGVSNQNPFYKDFTVDFSIFGYSLWHPALAIIAKLSSTDPIYVWHRLAVFLAPLILFSSYFFAHKIFRNKNAALICCLIIFYYIGFVNFLDAQIIKGVIFPRNLDLRILIYSRNINLFYIMPIFFGWFFYYLSKKQKRILILVSLLGLLIASVHLFYFVLVVFALGSFFVFFWLINRHETIKIKRIFWSLLIIILVSLPYLLLRLKTGLIAEGLIDSHNLFSINRGDVIVFGKNLMIVKPSYLDLGGGKILWGAKSLLSPWAYFVLTPLLFLWFRKKDWAIFLGAMMLIVPLLTFNPLAVLTLGKVIGLPKARFIYLIGPVYYLIGFFIWYFVNFLKDKLKEKNFLRAAIVAITIFFIIAFTPYKHFSALIKSYKFHIDDVYRDEEIYLPNSTIKFIKSVPKGSVFLASPQTSRIITMFSDNYVIDVLGSRSYFGNSVNQRKKDHKMILNPRGNIVKITRLLKKYKVDYILLNDNKNANFEENRLFKKVLRDSRIRIYEFNN